jgi:hypothetical protein
MLELSLDSLGITLQKWVPGWVYFQKILLADSDLHLKSSRGPGNTIDAGQMFGQEIERSGGESIRSVSLTDH